MPDGFYTSGDRSVQPVSPLPALATDLACALDPVRFMQSVGIEPDPWQRDVLRSSARQTLLCCSRQSGKSTTVAALAVHQALYTPDALILVFAPGLRQSVELFRKITGFYQTAGTPDPEAESSQKLELPNRSRILALPGTPDHVRGFSAPQLVIVDECAFVPDELIFAVSPMLAVSGGRFIGLSTPNGKRGWFHSAWTEGGDDWERVRVTAHDCTRIAAGFLESERRNLPPHRFASEYLCEFTDTEDAVFSSDLVRAAVTDQVQPLLPAFRW